TKPRRCRGLSKTGAGNETRTRDLNLGKVALYQLSYSRVEPRILPSPAGLSTTIFSPARRTGQAARRYASPDHSVSSAAAPSSQSPTRNTNPPIQMSVPGCSGSLGLIEYSRQDNATICAMVLILPIDRKSAV